MPRSWKPFARPLVVSVSPDPDLVVACDPKSRLPVAVVVKSLNTSSFDPSIPVTQVGSILILPPALKKCLIVSASANVTDLSMVDVEFHVPEFVEVPTAFVPSAVADVEPPATAAAKLARSVINADLIAMVSPADTDDAVIETFVWLAMLSKPVKSVFQLEALIVAPADTVEIDDCPNPYCAEPVPAKWLYPNGLELLLTNALYSSSKIVSPAVYAMLLFYSYHTFCECCFYVVFILDQPAQGVKSGTLLEICDPGLTVAC